MLDKDNLKALGIKIIDALTTFYKAVVQLVLKARAYIEEKKNNIPDWEIREKAHSPYIRYGLAIFLPLLAFIVKAAIEPFFLHEPAFLLFYAVIVITAWYGGSRPGIVATIFSILLAYNFYLVLEYPGAVGNNLLSSGFFFLEGMFIVGISHTMHKALQTYEEKKRYAQYYANIAQHMIDAVVSTDMEGIIQSWNEGAELLYGWKSREVISKYFEEVVPAIYPASVKKNIYEMLAQEKKWRGEVTHQRRNGSRVHVLTSMSLLCDEDDQPLGIVSVNRDITDRKKLEQGKDDFIALASHELKTPLTSIKLYTGILKQRFTKTNDIASQEYLTKIDSHMNKLLELVNHLLDVSKVQAGKIQFHMEEARIDDVVAEVVRDIQQITTTHRITIQGRTDKIVMIDRDRLRQVIVNILNNAVKYSSNADSVIVTLSKQNDEVRIAVKDFGVGIPKEKQAKIFDRFFQVADAKGYTYSGMGLGLYISHEIIERHSGKIWVESEEGKGSTFFITLPIVKKTAHGYKKEHSHRR